MERKPEDVSDRNVRQENTHWSPLDLRSLQRNWNRIRQEGTQTKVWLEICEVLLGVYYYPINPGLK